MRECFYCDSKNVKTIEITPSTTIFFFKEISYDETFSVIQICKECFDKYYHFPEDYDVIMGDFRRDAWQDK